MMNYLKNLTGNIRFYVLVFSAFLAEAIYLFVTSTVPPGSTQTIRLTQWYALTSLTFLYLTMLCGPFTKTFTFLPFRGKYVKARRALGVSAFLFAVLHSSIAFFLQLGGLAGLAFLSDKYLLAISLSFTAELILFLMAATSFDYMVEKLGFEKWKFLHRFVYVAALLILIHALMLGTHFADLSSTIPQIVFTAIGFYFVLQAFHWDKVIQERFPKLPSFGVISSFTLALLIVYSIITFLPSTGTGSMSFGIHAQHIKLAKDAQNPTLPAATVKIPGMQGDRSRRYTVSFNDPKTVQPGKPVTLNFTVYDASSGNKILLFNKIYEKVVHLIIVDRDLVYFNHIHPEQTGDLFTITTTFPHAGTYHLYLDFQPLGAVEQQFAFTLKTGGTEPKAKQTGNSSNSVTVDTYTVTMNVPNTLLAKDLSVGKTPISFQVKNTNGQDVKTLKPYLGAFGHLVMIQRDSYDYLHVHPSVIAKSQDEDGGPTVEFLPLGLYGPIKPGVYRVFAQFNPNNKLIVADFTVRVE